MFAHVSCFYHVLAILFLFLPLFLLTRRSIYFHVLSLTYTAKSYSHQFNRFICTTFRCALCSQDNIYKLLPTFCDHAVRAWFFIIIPACFLIFAIYMFDCMCTIRFITVCVQFDLLTLFINLQLGFHTMEAYWPPSNLLTFAMISSESNPIVMSKFTTMCVVYVLRAILSFSCLCMVPYRIVSPPRYLACANMLWPHTLPQNIITQTTKCKTDKIQYDNMQNS